MTYTTRRTRTVGFLSDELKRVRACAVQSMYESLVEELTGRGYKATRGNIPEEGKWWKQFCKISELTYDLDIPVEDWFRSQFEALKGWVQKKGMHYPVPSMMTSIKAVGRYAGWVRRSQERYLFIGRKVQQEEFQSLYWDIIQSEYTVTVVWMKQLEKDPKASRADVIAVMADLLDPLWLVSEGIREEDVSNWMSKRMQRDRKKLRIPRWKRKVQECKREAKLYVSERVLNGHTNIAGCMADLRRQAQQRFQKNPWDISPERLNKAQDEDRDRSILH